MCPLNVPWILWSEGDLFGDLGGQCSPTLYCPYSLKRLDRMPQVISRAIHRIYQAALGLVAVGDPVSGFHPSM